MKSLRELLQEQQITGHFSTEIEFDNDHLRNIVENDMHDEIDENDDMRVEFDDVKITRITCLGNESVRLAIEARLIDITEDDLDDLDNAPAPHCTCGAIVANDQRREHLTSHGLTVAAMTDAQIDACFET